MSENLDLLSGIDLQDQSEIHAGAALSLIPAGMYRFRLVAYVECGEAKVTGQYALDEKGKQRYKDRVKLGLVLFGKTLPEEHQGRVQWISLNKSFGKRSNFPKSFAKMNYDGSIKHFAEAAVKQMAGILKISVFVNEKGEERNSFNEEGVLAIQPPVVYSTDEDGEMVAKPVAVPETGVSSMVWLWDNGNAAQFASIKDTGFLIDALKEATNYAGSKAQLMIEGKTTAQSIMNAAAADQNLDEFDA